MRIVTFAIVKWTYGVPLDISILSDYHYFIIFLPPPPIPSSSPLQWGLSPPFVYGGDGEDCDNRRWKQCSVLIDAYIPSLLYYFLFLCLSLLPLPPPSLPSNPSFLSSMQWGLFRPSICEGVSEDCDNCDGNAPPL